MGLGEIQDGGCTVVMAVHCDGMRGLRWVWWWVVKAAD